MNLRNFKSLSLNCAPGMPAVAKIELAICAPSNIITRFAFDPLEPPAPGQHIGWNHPLYAAATP